MSAPEARERADRFLRVMWRDMRNNASAAAKLHILGAIEMAKWLGAFDDEHHELWLRRIDTCPGHDDEGGRNWCAYCGDMPRDTESAPRAESEET